MMLIKEVSRRVEMASKQTYECFVCKRNGFPDTRVYIDGKTGTVGTLLFTTIMCQTALKGGKTFMT
jgi:hypothetical protein